MSEEKPSKPIKNTTEPVWSPQGGKGYPICDCKDGPGCLWEEHRHALVDYWLECRAKGKEVGQLGQVEDSNLRARRILYKVFNKSVGREIMQSAPECVVSGLSYLFSLQEFADGTPLDEFKTTGKRRCMH